MPEHTWYDADVALPNPYNVARVVVLLSDGREVGAHYVHTSYGNGFWSTRDSAINNALGTAEISVVEWRRDDE